jgi:hypothetical protein
MIMKKSKNNESVEQQDLSFEGLNFRPLMPRISECARKLGLSEVRYVYEIVNFFTELFYEFHVFIDGFSEKNEDGTKKDPNDYSLTPAMLLALETEAMDLVRKGVVLFSQGKANMNGK